MVASVNLLILLHQWRWTCISDLVGLTGDMFGIKAHCYVLTYAYVYVVTLSCLAGPWSCRISAIHFFTKWHDSRSSHRCQHHCGDRPRPKSCGAMLPSRLTGILLCQVFWNRKYINFCMYRHFSALLQSCLASWLTFCTVPVVNKKAVQPHGRPCDSTKHPYVLAIINPTHRITGLVCNFC